MDSTTDLDYMLALRNVRTDLIGDWYRDPWSWPEYDYVRRQSWASLSPRAAANGIRRVAIVDVPKENFGIRPAIVMDPLDRLLYQAVVDHVSQRITSDLGSWVFGWRLPRREPRAGRYSRNSTEWRYYREGLSRLAAGNSCGLRTDIVACFASIPVIRVAEDVERLAKPSPITDRLANLLVAFDGVPRRGGLPQRSKASSILANMYLRRIDRVLREHDERRSTDPVGFFFGAGGTLRWMDDIWVFGEDEGSLRAVQLKIQDAARDARLELNLAKTSVKSGENLIAAARHIQHSAIDEALEHNPPEYRPLQELIDQLIDDPEHADRSLIHFATERMRGHRLKSRRRALIAVAERMPHGADHLARAFRDLGWWRGLQDWYLDYRSGPWAVLDWSVANFGAMFPSSGRVSGAIHECMAETLTSRPSIPLFALAAQRLASWKPMLARDTIREVLPAADHPLERRILGLAALQVNEERSFIRGVLGEYDENVATLQMIEDRSFAPIDPSPDFGAISDSR
jgi:Reverse transcriptase (RNA-dependent DNA polymerase)